MDKYDVKNYDVDLEGGDNQLGIIEGLFIIANEKALSNSLKKLELVLRLEELFHNNKISKEVYENGMKKVDVLK